MPCSQHPPSAAPGWRCHWVWFSPGASLLPCFENRWSCCGRLLLPRLPCRRVLHRRKLCPARLHASLRFSSFQPCPNPSPAVCSRYPLVRVPLGLACASPGRGVHCNVAILCHVRISCIGLFCGLLLGRWQWRISRISILGFVACLIDELSPIWCAARSSEATTPPLRCVLPQHEWAGVPVLGHLLLLAPPLWPAHPLAWAPPEQTAVRCLLPCVRWLDPSC